MAENRFKSWLDWAHHVYWIADALISLGIAHAVVTWIGKHIQIAPEWNAAIWLILSGVICAGLMYAFGLWQLKHRPAPKQPQTLAENANEALSPGVDIDQCFRASYRSPTIEQEAQKNIRILAHQRNPNEIERFYLDLIGVGLMAALYDSIWWPMFRSQLLALLEVNRQNGVLPKTKVKGFYEKAAEEYPKDYTDDTFDRWFSYLTKNGLVIDHPSNMVEITVRGKDFLKYLTHWGRESKDKRL
jgi:hypothetical protein